MCVCRFFLFSKIYPLHERKKLFEHTDRYFPLTDVLYFPILLYADFQQSQKDREKDDVCREKNNTQKLESVKVYPKCWSHKLLYKYIDWRGKSQSYAKHGLPLLGYKVQVLLQQF